MASALVALCLMAPSPIAAQRGGLRASPGTVVGLVNDTSGTPVDADVALGSEKRRVTTGVDGRFRFDDVKAGSYVIVARRVGFSPRSATIVVTDTGVVVRLTLVPLPNRLPPVITTADRGGLSGVIGDTTFSALKGARIEVIGSGRATTTDSAGEFFVDVNTGKYMVKVSHAGFATRLVSVTVPVMQGKRMQLWLTPAARASTNRDEAAVRALQARLIRRGPAFSSLFTSEDIEKVGFRNLSQIASSAAVQYVDNSCPVMFPAFAESQPINGMSPTSLPMWAVDAKDLEFVEVYTTKPARNTQTSIRAGPRVARPAAQPRCPTIIAWLRK